MIVPPAGLMVALFPLSHHVIHVRSRWTLNLKHFSVVADHENENLLLSCLNETKKLNGWTTVWGSGGQTREDNHGLHRQTDVRQREKVCIVQMHYWWVDELFTALVCYAWSPPKAWGDTKCWWCGVINWSWSGLKWTSSWTLMIQNSSHAGAECLKVDLFANRIRLTDFMSQWL